MKEDIVIEFKNVNKTYKLFKSDKQRFLGLILKNIKCKENKAVNDVSFQIKRGESVEVTYPTEGTIEVNGRVSALLELTSGFDPEFTGRENIYLKGQILGLANDEIKKLEPKIIEFAELDDYIDQPVRTYSSGMKARLGFSINVNIEPEILIVDEALSVGDEEFRRKCIKKINELLEQDNVTLLFVTHATRTAKDFCKRGMVMQKGKVVFDGDIETAMNVYNDSLKK